ncbi:MAG: 50S ribosomal protein L6 [Candidatus Andersenbacteria bacterium]|nr:50S ribosomal protein L6 [bacterium]MDZ4225626.1 50S ribosomal protein L6 [Candidatus Andersenbacteria bacterium]
MSRIGKQPIVIPDGVTAEVAGREVKVKGPLGELVYGVHPAIGVALTDGELVVRVVKPGKKAAALWGTTRARLANIVEGVTKGFSKQLELQGVGFRAQAKGDGLDMSLGFSHPISVKAPEGIKFTVEKEIITITGRDNVLVGQVAADIRKLRPPEPYKGKGVRYVGEHVRRKVGKVVGSTTE